jgi:hypothetical protein
MSKKTKIKSYNFSPLFSPKPVTALERLECKYPGFKLIK